MINSRSSLRSREDCNTRGHGGDVSSTRDRAATVNKIPIEGGSRSRKSRWGRKEHRGLLDTFVLEGTSFI